jgi:hypothetical protein
MTNNPVFIYRNALNTNQFPATRSTFTIVSHQNEEPLDCGGIGVCRADRSGTVTAQYSADGVNWTTATNLSFAKDRTAAVTFEPATALYWRAVFDAPTSVGVVKIGKALHMDQRNYADVSPPPFNQTDSRRPASLSRGQWLGRHTHGRRSSASYRSTHIGMQWVKENALDLFEALRDGDGVFYLWRPEKYPGDVIYGFLASDINPTNAGTLDFMDFTIELTGIYDNSKPVYTGPNVIIPGES